MSQSGAVVDTVSSDISLTGLRLRLPKPADRVAPVDLAVYLPNDDLEQYQRQDPFQIQGKIVWQRQEGEGYLCGVEFLNLDENKRNTIRKCFAYFRKNAGY